MKVVVVDSARLGAEAEFPPLAADKFGWEQFPALGGEEMAERCWRAHVVVTVAAPLGAEEMARMTMLSLIAVAGEAAGHVDLDAARAAGVAVCHVPGTDPADPVQAQRICDEVVANINAFMDGQERHRLV
jgi:lactate dehydrogenase-like 2-hydroxyacid dehydrogenase